MNWDLIKQWIFVAIRYLSPYLAAYMSTKFGIATEEAATWIATSLTILMAAWALWNKAAYEAKVNTALDMHAGASKDTLKTVIANGDGTSALAAK